MYLSHMQFAVIAAVYKNPGIHSNCVFCLKKEVCTKPYLEKNKNNHLYINMLDRLTNNVVPLPGLLLPCEFLKAAEEGEEEDEDEDSFKLLYSTKPSPVTSLDAINCVFTLVANEPITTQQCIQARRRGADDTSKLSVEHQSAD